MPTREKDRPGPGARRVGYVVAILANLAILLALTRWPGWETVAFLTPDTARVLGIVTVSLLVGIVANGVYLAIDPPPVRALGDIVTTSVGLVALVRIWRVFPFAFTGDIPWTTIVRVLLVLGMAGSVVGIVAPLVRLMQPDRS